MQANDNKIADTRVKRDGEILRNWLNNAFPRAQYNEIKRRIVDACKVKESRLRNWFYMSDKIPALYKKEINKITLEVSGVEIFNIEDTAKEGDEA